MLFVFLSFWHVILSTVLCDTPTEEMEKFIDECNVMIDTMDSCEQGWIDLEETLISTVDYFADEILYTEGLILDEADEILNMADRIVETESIMVNLTETCGCASAIPHSNSDTTAETNTNAIDLFDNDPYDMLPTSLGADAGADAVQFDRCTAMDMVIEVMDECLTTFAIFNDDFLLVLNSMVPSLSDICIAYSY